MFCGDDGAVVKNYVAKQEGMCDFLNTQTISCCSVLARLDGVVELKVQVYFRHIMNASVGEFEPADARGRVGRVSLLPAFTSNPTADFSKSDVHGAVLSFGNNAHGASGLVGRDHNGVGKGALALLHAHGLAIEILQALFARENLLPLAACGLIEVRGDDAVLAARALRQGGLLVPAEGARSGCDRASSRDRQAHGRGAETGGEHEKRGGQERRGEAGEVEKCFFGF